MIRLMSFLAIGLIIEMVFFGPLGLTVYDISIRKALIAALVVSSISPILTQKPAETWQVILLIFIVLFMLVWGLLVPMANGVDLKMSIAEIQPIVAVLLIFPFYLIFKTYGPEPCLRAIRWATAGMALAVIFIWACSNVLGMANIGYQARNFYINLNDSDIGVYIGPMPDGSFRVMLINFALFPIMLSYYNWNKFNPLWSLFYLLATFATGTRAFLGVGVLVVGLTFLRKRPIVAIPIAAIVIGFLTVYVLSHQELHIFDLNSDLTSSSARYVQFFSLMNLFWQHPIFGAGLGASASVVRSFDAPYSYELTYVALLAKLGVVGSIAILLVFLTWISRLIKNNSNWLSIVGLLVASILMTSTNPYLINLVGMSIFAFLVALGIWKNHVENYRTTLLLKYDGEI